MPTERTHKLLWWFSAASGNYAVVASIARGPGGGDWAAYLGQCDSQDAEEDLREVVARGAKLPEAAARGFAGTKPDVADLLYRA